MSLPGGSASRDCVTQNFSVVRDVPWCLALLEVLCINICLVITQQKRIFPKINTMFLDLNQFAAIRDLIVDLACK